MKPPPLPKPDESNENREDPLDDHLLPEALVSLRNQLNQEKSGRRNTTFALSLALIVIFLIIGVIVVTGNQRSEDRVNQSRAACEGGNKLRDQIREIGLANNARTDKFISIAIAAGKAAGPPVGQTEEERIQSEATLKEFQRLDKIESDRVKEVVGQIKDNDCKELYK